MDLNPQPRIGPNWKWARALCLWSCCVVTGLGLACSPADNEDEVSSKDKTSLFKVYKFTSDTSHYFSTSHEGKFVSNTNYYPAKYGLPARAQLKQFLSKSRNSSETAIGPGWLRFEAFGGMSIHAVSEQISALAT